MATNLKASDKDADMYHLSMSEEAEPLLAAVKKFCAEEVAPIADQFYKLGEGRKDRWSWAPGQLELLDKAKAFIAAEHKPDGYNIGVNAGRAGGQSRMHVHVHLIPRYTGDVADPSGGIRCVLANRHTSSH